jgi:hypothetical protein
MYSRNPRDYLPDVRDGLTHRERIVLQCLHALQQERGGRNVPTGMLYGSVIEYVFVSRGYQAYYYTPMSTPERRPRERWMPTARCQKWGHGVTLWAVRHIVPL